MAKPKRKIWTRPLVQLFFFLLIAAISINHYFTNLGGGIKLLSSASLHALCPFGGVTTIYQYATTGTFVKKLHESSFILMIIGFVLAVGFGPVFCGWVCPLGSFQEWISKIGQKLFKKRFNHFIPYRIDKYLRYLRYFVAAWVIYMVAKSGEIVVFQDIDPYYALFNFWTGEVATAGFIVLGITMLAALFVERPWCKYACPYGAVLGLTNLVSIFKIHRSESSCIACGACDRACPMNISVSKKVTIRDHQCIACLKCTSEEGCPIEDTAYMASEVQLPPKETAYLER